MYQKRKKATALIMAALMAASSAQSGIFASSLNETERGTISSTANTDETGSGEISTGPETEGLASAPTITQDPAYKSDLYSIALDLRSSNGVVVIDEGKETQQTVSVSTNEKNETISSVVDASGALVKQYLVTEESPYAVVWTEGNGDKVNIKAIANDGYTVSTYESYVLNDTATEYVIQDIGFMPETYLTFDCTVTADTNRVIAVNFAQSRTAQPQDDDIEIEPVTMPAPEETVQSEPPSTEEAIDEAPAQVPEENVEEPIEESVAKQTEEAAQSEAVIPLTEEAAIPESEEEQAIETEPVGIAIETEPAAQDQPVETEPSEIRTEETAVTEAVREVPEEETEAASLEEMAVPESEEIQEEITLEETEADVPGENMLSEETEAEVSNTFADDTTSYDFAADFSSMRLVVIASDPAVIIDPEHVVGNYGDIYLLQYATVQQAMAAYAYYMEKAEAVEPDAVVEAAGEAEETTQPAEFSNPVNNIATAATFSGSNVIALLDTGASESANVIGSVSLIDSQATGTGHADEMVKAILSQNPDAQILSVRVMDDSGKGSVSSVVSGIEYAITQNVSIINISAYTRNGISITALEKEIEKATSLGIRVVGSAGNDGSNVSGYTPGRISNAYIIGACDENGNKAALSNFGESVDFYAVASTTSEAAALFSGYISANDVNTIDGNGPLFFAPGGAGREEEPTEETESEIPESEPERIVPTESHFLEPDPRINELDSEDFSTMRLVVMADAEDTIIDKEHLIDSYNNIYLLQYDALEQTMTAYLYYQEHAQAVEPDTMLFAAEEEEAPEEDGSDIPPVLEYDYSSRGMEKGENPVGDAAKEPGLSASYSGVIALIDSGTKEGPNVISRISVLGEDLSGTGHGDRMVESIVSQNPSAQILSIKALSNNSGSVSSVVSAMEYAIEQGVSIINLSISAKKTLSSAVVTTQIQKAVEAGIIVVGAAGNNGSDAADYIPGGEESAWILGSCNDAGNRNSNSNFGATVDLYAVANSTSEAAALFAGYVSANGLPTEPMTGPVFFTEVGEPDGSDDSKIEEGSDEFSEAATVSYPEDQVLQTLQTKLLIEKAANRTHTSHPSDKFPSDVNNYNLFQVNMGCYSNDLINPGTYVRYANFYADTNNDGVRDTPCRVLIYCLDPSKKSPFKNGKYAFNQKINKPVSPKARKASYYLYGGPEYATQYAELGGISFMELLTKNKCNSTAARYNFTHFYLAYAQDGPFQLKRFKPKGKRLAKQIDAYMDALPDPPENYIVYQFDSQVKTGQDQLIGGYIPDYPPEPVCVQKVSANPAITEGNGSYTFTGAVFNIYKDANCTELLGSTYVTDATGYASSTVPVAAGDTVYFKEAVAPFGYKMNPNVYPLTVTDESNTVSIPDEPMFVSPGVLLKKDPTPSKTANASLAGATFRIDYYNQLIPTGYVGDVKNFLNGHAPTASWNETSLANGDVQINNSPFTDPSNPANDHHIVPLGSVVATEISPPTNGRYYVNTAKVIATFQTDGTNITTKYYILGEDNSFIPAD